MPTCRGVISPANFSCQLFESYFTCQHLMPTFRELCHPPTSHANCSIVTPPANFSCQLFGCYLIILKAQADLSGVTSLILKHKLTFLLCLHFSTLNSSAFSGGGRPDRGLRNVPICLERGKPSAEIVRVEALSLCLDRGEPSAEIVRVEVLSLWRRPCEFSCFRCSRIVFESCLVACAPAFAIAVSRVRFPPGPRQLRLKNKNSQLPKYSTETVLPQLWLEKGNFGVQKCHAKCVPAAPAELASFKYTQAAREERCSSGSKIAIF